MVNTLSRLQNLANPQWTTCMYSTAGYTDHQSALKSLGSYALFNNEVLRGNDFQVTAWKIWGGRELW